MRQSVTPQVERLMERVGMKLLRDMLQATKERPRQQTEHQVFFEVYDAKLGLTQAIEDAVSEEQRLAVAEGRKAAMYATVRQDWLLAKYEAADDAVKAAVRAKVKESHGKAMEKYDRTLDPTVTQTPEECAEYVKRVRAHFACVDRLTDSSMTSRLSWRCWRR